MSDKAESGELFGRLYLGLSVMAGRVPAIRASSTGAKMAGTRPAMTLGVCRPAESFSAIGILMPTESSPGMTRMGGPVPLF